MADSKELQNQLQIQQGINKVLQDRQKILEKQQKYLSSQVDTAVQLCKALECKGLDDIQQRMKEVQAGLAGAAQEAGDVTDRIGEVNDALDDTNKKAETSVKSFGELVGKIKETNVALAGFAVGAAKGFKSAIADIKMMGGAIGTAINGIFNIGKAIIAIPFQMFSGLLGMANNLASATNVLGEAVEEVRKEFGNLHSNEGKALMSGMRDLQSSASDLGGTGVSLGKVYGVGPGGVAAAMKDLQGIASALGSKFGMLSEEFANSAGEILAFKKGMGLSDDAMSGFATRAISSGKSLTNTLQDVGNYSIQLGDKFGVSSKLISRDMGEMAADFKNFGTLSTKEMAAASVYARKLGIDVKGLQGVIGQFDDFEGAADSVSQLNQAFGIQLDTMAMMNAENPAERIDMMKNAFHEAGKSVEDMTRQERALLAEQTGLSEEALATAFSQENMGTSYEDIAAGADEAEEKQLSQTEVMNKLADTLDRVFNSGRQFTGVFDALAQGFSKGLSDNKEFRDLLKQIREAMQVVFDFGRELGQMFANLLGDMGVFYAIKDHFNIYDIKNLLGIGGTGGVLGIFKKFKDSITGKGDYSPQQMAQELTDLFKNFFAAKSGPLGKLSKMIEQGIIFLGEQIAKMIPWVADKFVAMIHGIIDVVRNPDAVRDAAKDGIGGAMSQAMSQIVPALMSAVGDMIGALVELIGAVLWENKGKLAAVGAVMMAWVFGKMIVLGAMNAIGAAVGAVAVKKLTDWILSMVGDVAEQTEQQMPDPRQMEQMGESVGAGLKSAIEQINQLEEGDMMKAGWKLAVLVASFIPAVIAFSIAIAIAAGIIGMVSWSSLGKLMVTMAVMIPFLALVMIAAKFLDPGTMLSSAVNMALAAVAIGLGMIPFAAALWAVHALIGGIPFKEIAKIMAIMGLAVLAVFVISKLGLLLAPPVTIPGLAFMALAGLAMSVSMVIFAVALRVVHAILAPLPFKEIVKVFAMLGLAIVATIALAATALAGLAIAAMFPAMVVGLLAAAAFLTVGVAIFAGALFLVSKIPLPDISTTAEIFASIGIALLALVALSVAGIAFAVIMPLLPIMTVGLIAAAAFFTAGVTIFVTALAQAEKMAGATISSPAIQAMIDTMINVILAMKMLIPLAVVFTALSPILPILGIGLRAMGKFFVSAAESVASMITAAEGIPMKDPEDLAKRLEVVGHIAKALQALGGLAIDAAKLGVASELMGGPSMSEVFEAMGGFLDKIKDTLVSTVETLVKMAMGFSKSQLEKASVVASVVEAVASFAAAMAEPLKVVQSMTGFFNPSVASNMAVVISGLGDIMDMLAEKLPMIIGGLVKAGEGIPSGFGEKAEAMKIMFEALGPMMNALAKVQEIMEASLEGINGPQIDELFGGMAGALTAITGVMPGVVADLNALVGAEQMQEQVAKLETMFTATEALANVLGKFAEFAEGQSPGLMGKAGAAIAGLFGGGEAETPAVAVIKSMVDDMVKINDVMATLPEVNIAANLQQIADAFGVTESIAVENKPVNITINLSVTMDANKVGAVLVDKSVMTTALATAGGAA